MSVDQKFEDAVCYVQKGGAKEQFPEGQELSNEAKLTFYGLYKQAQNGKCDVPRPSFWDVVGKAKWDAWNKHGNMSSRVAKQKYIDHLTSLAKDWQQWRGLPSATASTNILSPIGAAAASAARNQPSRAISPPSTNTADTTTLPSLAASTATTTTTTARPPSTTSTTSRPSSASSTSSSSTAHHRKAASPPQPTSLSSSSSSSSSTTSWPATQTRAPATTQANATSAPATTQVNATSAPATTQANVTSAPATPQVNAPATTQANTTNSTATNSTTATTQANTTNSTATAQANVTNTTATAQANVTSTTATAKAVTSPSTHGRGSPATVKETALTSFTPVASKASGLTQTTVASARTHKGEMSTGTASVQGVGSGPQSGVSVAIGVGSAPQGVGSSPQGVGSSSRAVAAKRGCGSGSGSARSSYAASSTAIDPAVVLKEGQGGALQSLMRQHAETLAVVDDLRWRLARLEAANSTEIGSQVVVLDLRTTFLRNWRFLFVLAVWGFFMRFRRLLPILQLLGQQFFRRR